MSLMANAVPAIISARTQKRGSLLEKRLSLAEGFYRAQRMTLLNLEGPVSLLAGIREALVSLEQQYEQEKQSLEGRLLVLGAQHSAASYTRTGSYEKQVYDAGGFSWTFKTQMYPPIYGRLAVAAFDRLSVKDKTNPGNYKLQFPVTARTSLPEASVRLFRQWVKDRTRQ